jgi:hypothetical protein
MNPRGRNHEQQTNPDWLRAYGVRSSVGGTVAEFAVGHRARHCRYRGHAKTHTQHILTAIVINVERLYTHESPGQRERQHTALQKYIIGREHRSRTGGAKKTEPDQDPQQSPSMGVLTMIRCVKPSPGLCLGPGEGQCLTGR